jgi:hypothetical protein
MARPILALASLLLALASLLLSLTIAFWGDWSTDIDLSQYTITDPLQDGQWRTCEPTLLGWQCSTTDGPSIEIIEDRVPFPEARDT